jgi:hypothetical protein
MISASVRLNLTSNSNMISAGVRMILNLNLTKDLRGLTYPVQISNWNVTQSHKNLEIHDFTE